MALLWKSQNDFHRSLEISQNARFPHSHSASSLRSVDKNVEGKGTSQIGDFWTRTIGLDTGHGNGGTCAPTRGGRPPFLGEAGSPSRDSAPHRGHAVPAPAAATLRKSPRAWRAPPRSRRADRSAAFFFRASPRTLEAPRVHVEPESGVNPGQQRPGTERRILRAQRRHKGQHRVVEFVGAVRPAFPWHQPRDPPSLAGGLRLMERQARDPKRIGVCATGCPSMSTWRSISYFTCTRSGDRKSRARRTAGPGRPGNADGARRGRARRRLWHRVGMIGKPPPSRIQIRAVVTL
jgi:hypothetical protein